MDNSDKIEILPRPNGDNRDSNENQRKQIKALFKNYIENNDIKKLDDLLDNKCNIKILKKEKFLDPFAIAIRSNNLDIFKYLNEKGFKLKGSNLMGDSNQQLQQQQQHQQTSKAHSYYSYPLIEAIKCLNLDAVNLLIFDLNIDVNSSNYKYVPLQIAYNIYSSERDKLLLNPIRNKHRIEV